MSLMTIRATKDVSTNQASPSTNFNSTSRVIVGKFASGSNISRPFLYFDLSALTGLTINSIKLYLYNEASGSSSGTLTFDLYRVIETWSETTLTWTSSPDSEATPTITGLTAAYSSSNVWRNWTITSLITECLSNTYYGIKMRSQDEATENGKYFYARELGDGTAPYLLVDYVGTPEPTAPTVTTPSPITTASKTFDWSDASDAGGIFTASQLYYEMQISLDNGASWGATQTSSQGVSSKTLDMKSYLSLQTLQYYNNTQVKIRVRTKTPAYEGTTYYSAYVTSSAFTIDYRITPSAPTIISFAASLYEGETQTFTLGRPTSYNTHTSSGSVNSLTYEVAFPSGPSLVNGDSAVTNATKALSYVVGNLTTPRVDLATAIKARCWNIDNLEVLYGAYSAEQNFTIKRFRAPIINISEIDRSETEAVIHIEIQDTGYGATQSSDQINKVQYDIGGGYADASLGAWDGLKNSFTITGLSASNRYSVNVKAINNAPDDTALSSKTSSAYSATIVEFTPAWMAFKNSVSGVSGSAQKSLIVGDDYTVPVEEGCAVVQNDLDVGGNITASNFTPVVACRAYMSASQENLVSGTWTTVLLDATDYDTHNGFSAANHRYTFPESGYYLINANLRFTNLVADKPYGAAFNKNVGEASVISISGSYGVCSYALATPQFSVPLSTIYYFSAGETITLSAVSQAGVNTVDLYAITSTHTYCYMEILKIR
jgi:hypothetical protein